MVIMMLNIPQSHEHVYSLQFESDICATFGHETLIDLYDTETDELIASIDPTDLTSLYHAYRGMVYDAIREDCIRKEHHARS